MPASAKVSVMIPLARHREAQLVSLRSLVDSERLAEIGPVEVLLGCAADDAAPEIELPAGMTLRQVAQGSSQSAAGQNALIRAAAGELIAFCHPGDTFAPGKLAEQVRLLAGDPALAAAFSFAEFTDPAGRPDVELAGTFNVDLDEEELAHRLLAGNVLIASTAMVPKAALAAVGPLDESLLFAQDFELWLRLLLHGGVRIIPIALSACRLGGREPSREVQRRVAQESWQVLSRHAGAVMRRFPPLPQANYAFLSHMVALASQSGDWQVAIDYLSLKRQCFGHDDADCLQIAHALVELNRLDEARAYLDVLRGERGRMAPSSLDQVVRLQAALAGLGREAAAAPPPACPP